MANIFGILTALALALSLWIGYRNNTEFEKQIDLQERAERKLTANEGEYKTLSKKLQAVGEEQAALEDELEDEQAKLSDLSEGLVETESNNKEKRDAFNGNEEAVAAAEAQIADLPDPEEILPAVMEIQKKVAQAQVDVASSKDSLADAQRETDALAKQIKEKQESLDARSGGGSLPDLSATIKGVYRNWGFVTLGAGNVQGVVPGSILDVVRDGETVAKLKVTAVEENRSAADILLDDLPVVVSLRPGDRVVAEKVSQ